MKYYRCKHHENKVVNSETCLDCWINRRITEGIPFTRAMCHGENAEVLPITEDRE
jgi:hypothetical protein